MELKHLIKTLELCIERHTERGNETKVSILKNQLTRVKDKRLTDTIEINGLYMGE